MESIRTDNYGGVSELLESMATGINMLEAFAAMLGHTLNTGEDSRAYSYGIEEIVQQQCQDLRFIQLSLAKQFNALRQEKLVIKDIDEVAQLCGIPVEIAERCVSFATCISFRKDDRLDAGQPDAA